MPFSFNQKLDLVTSDAKVEALTTVDASDVDAAAVVAATAGLKAQVTQLEAQLDEYKKKVEQKEEEVRLYKAKYDETSKQVADLVSDRDGYYSGDTRLPLIKLLYVLLNITNFS